MNIFHVQIIKMIHKKAFDILIISKQVVPILKCLKFTFIKKFSRSFAKYRSDVVLWKNLIFKKKLIKCQKFNVTKMLNRKCSWSLKKMIIYFTKRSPGSKFTICKLQEKCTGRRNNIFDTILNSWKH